MTTLERGWGMLARGILPFPRSSTPEGRVAERHDRSCRALRSTQVCSGWQRRGAPLHQPRPNVDFRGQCPMHGAALRDLYQSAPLFICQRPVQGYVAFDAVELAFFGLTLRAV